MAASVHLGMYMLQQFLKCQNKQHIIHQFGKWHCGMSNNAYLPVNRGFDSSFGYLGGAEDHYKHTQGGAIDFWNTTHPINNYNGIYGDIIYNN